MTPPSPPGFCREGRSYRLDSSLQTVAVNLAASIASPAHEFECCLSLRSNLLSDRAYLNPRKLAQALNHLLNEHQATQFEHCLTAPLGAQYSRHWHPGNHPLRQVKEKRFSTSRPANMALFNKSGLVRKEGMPKGLLQRSKIGRI